MPSSGYVADTFVAGEQPTTSKWNELWGNDASFNSGAGFNDSIVIARHMAANAVKAPALALSNALDSTNGVQTAANAGSWGGNNNYINLGGIKLCWGLGATTSITTGSDKDQAVTLPASFFSSVQAVNVGTTSPSGGAFANWVLSACANYSTSSLDIILHNFGSGTATAIAPTWLVIGT